VVVATVAAAALAGQLAAGDPEPEASRALRVADATIRVPAAWRVVDEPAPPGATVLAPGDPALARVLVAVARPDDPSLVPPALRRAFTGLDPASRTTRLGGYRAWSYRVPDRAAEVTVLPSSRGVVGIACVPRRAGAQGRCASAVRTVSVARAAILTPAPDLALRLRAPETLAALDATRVRMRAELGGSAARARLSRDLAREHEAALDALRPVAGATGATLTSALAEAGRAYDAFADAAHGSSLDGARADVDAADAAVEDAVAKLAATGAPSVQRRSPAPPATKGASALTLSLVLAIGLLGVMLVPVGASRALAARRRAVVAPAEPEPCVVAPLRRRLLSPPPTCGRWDETPTGYGGREAPATAAADHGVVVDSVKVSVLP
jgi:hypothetical protein